jgi:archaea-specific RecJ-like exonuclease
MSSNENSMCFSHIEDPDGIISAALIKQIFNCNIHLVDYNNFISEIKKIEKNLNLKNLIICDLEIKLNSADTFFEIIENLSKKKISILYIDHHNLDSNISKQLKKFNVKIIHSENECTSSLIYDNFINKLKKNASLLAACACITDKRDDTVIAKKILQKNDKMYVYLNSSLIWYYIKNNQNHQKKLYDVVNLFYNNQYPLEIINICSEAEIISTDLNNLTKNIYESVKHLKKISYAEIFNNKLEFAANGILSMSDKNVSLVFKTVSNKNIKELVILSNNTSKNDIGKNTNIIASKLNGFGGGDPKKSAAIISNKNFEKFLEEFDHSLE